MKIIHYSEQDAITFDNKMTKHVLGRLVIGSKDGASKFFMRIFELQKGSYTPRHFHEWEHEIFVYSGRGEVFHNSQWVPIITGNVLFIPGEEEHQFRNIKEELFTFVCIVPSSAPEI